MLFTKLEQSPNGLTKGCACKNPECGVLNGHYTMFQTGNYSPVQIMAETCGFAADYTLDGMPLCTACARFRRLPT